MASAEKIALPEQPESRWTRSDVMLSIALAVVVAGLSAWAAWGLGEVAASGARARGPSTAELGLGGDSASALATSSSDELGLRHAGRYVPLALGLAAPFLVALLAIAIARSTSAGRAVWLLAPRAGFPPGVMRWVDKTSMRCVLGSLTLAPLGIVLAIVDSAWWARALVPAGLALLLLGMASVVVGRVAMVLSARRLVRRLPTTDLAQLSANDHNIELDLRVADDALTVELPFLEGRYACVQLRYGHDIDDHVRTWPERLAVRDATGVAELALDSFEVSGWRWRHAIESWTGGDRPPIVALIEQAVGASITAPEETNVSWAIWAMKPGDPIYLVGEAREMGRALSAYRGGGQTTLGSRSAIPAVAIVGDESSLRERFASELRMQAIVTLVAHACLAAALVALVVLAG